jgi:hypothetical protein
VLVEISDDGFDLGVRQPVCDEVEGFDAKGISDIAQRDYLGIADDLRFLHTWLRLAPELLRDELQRAPQPWRNRPQVGAVGQVLDAAAPGAKYRGCAGAARPRIDTDHGGPLAASAFSCESGFSS